MKNIAILGSTGSIGTQTLEVIREHAELFRVAALAAGTNSELIMKQIQEFQPDLVAVATEEVAASIRPHVPEHISVHTGMEGLIKVATYDNVHTLVTAVVGSVGLKPTLAAIEAGKRIALANKETLVTAGQIVMDQAEKHDVEIIPVDSEHSAIFQCLHGENIERVEEMILTASGGSFRHKSREELVNVTVDDALKHPNWSMGAKITIDSATMMNKGFEVIEAHWLFGIPYDQINVLLHQESIIHSLVVFEDSSVIAEMGTPDMKVPIQYALTFPDRLSRKGERLQLAQVGKLHFQDVSDDRFPCLRMAFEAGRKGGTYPTVLNAANEVAVQRFLQSDISFLEIEEVIERTLEKHESVTAPGLEEIEHADQWARHMAQAVERR